MRHRTAKLTALAAFLSSAAALGHGCSASNDPGTTGFGGDGSGASGTGSTMGSGLGGAGGSGNHGVGGSFTLPDSGGPDVGDVSNPCGSECGPDERCDEAHLGLDDNCNGEVDEGCSCVSGQAHFCFKGDPSYRGKEGCFDGVEKCSELGKWGSCVGGVHAIPPDSCGQGPAPVGCHAMQTAPFADVTLKDGTGTFSDDADPGTETWTVACPTGVDPCPAVTAPDAFKPLQSGEYTVTYTKEVGGEPDTCTYPLFVGARGLRVELSWEHPEAAGVEGGVDLDLHLHKPNAETHWGMDGFKDDCGYANCTIDTLIVNLPLPGLGKPKWFADPPATPPTPVNWYEDPIEANNTCYFAPRGAGQRWKNKGKGCYSPRLDVDNIHCDTGVTNPKDDSFCTPENINVDFPPADEWMRIGVYYYGNPGKDYTVHPNVKVFCNGALAAELGNVGYGTPEAAVDFPPSQGSKRFWQVADVVFPKSDCGAAAQCIVRPLYADDTTKTPAFISKQTANQQFGPVYPPLP